MPNLFKCFFQCISKSPEILLILKRIVPVEFDGKSQTQLAELQRNLGTLCGNDSVFQFISSSYVLNGALSDVKSNDEETIIKLRREATALKSAKTKNANEIDKLKSEINALKLARN